MTFTDKHNPSNSDWKLYLPQLQKTTDLYFQFPLFDSYNIDHILVQSLVLIHPQLLKLWHYAVNTNPRGPQNFKKYAGGPVPPKIPKIQPPHFASLSEA